MKAVFSGNSAATKTNMAPAMPHQAQHYQTRAPSDWLILELFSFTEQRNNFFYCISMVKQVLARHGI
jgi:hypothetical protein